MSFKLSEWKKKTLKSIYVLSEVLEFAYLKVLTSVNPYIDVNENYEDFDQ
jgi:hypothetical protein